MIVFHEDPTTCDDPSIKNSEGPSNSLGLTPMIRSTGIPDFTRAVLSAWGYTVTVTYSSEIIIRETVFYCIFVLLEANIVDRTQQMEQIRKGSEEEIRK